LTRPQDPSELSLVTFQKKKSSVPFKMSQDIWLTIILITLVLTIWILFSPLGIG